MGPIDLFMEYVDDKDSNNTENVVRTMVTLMIVNIFHGRILRGENRGPDPCPAWKSEVTLRNSGTHPLEKQRVQLICL